MKITLYVIGSLKESYWKDAVAEYSKRLRPYCDLRIEECPDFPCPEKASPKEIEQVKKKEAAAILRKLKKNDYLIALDLNGRQLDSVAFAKQMEKDLTDNGASISFLIGGSTGIDAELLARANESICLGKNTYPHQLVRVMLLEQIYRAFKILRGEPYHK